MAIVKSKLLKQFKKSYPNFHNKDLDKLFTIVLNEIKRALRRNEGVELRNFGSFRSRIQKSSIFSFTVLAEVKAYNKTFSDYSNW